MDNQAALETLNDIRKIMEKSSRFLSLSGLSAIIIGIYACIAALLAYLFLGGEVTTPYAVSNNFPILQVNTASKLRLLVLSALILIILCIVTAILMSKWKARQNNQHLSFDRTAKRLLWNFFLPLVAGGILCLSLLYQQHYGLTSSVMLIFYGLALINASSYTYSHTRYLGYAEVILGLADSFVEGYALLFWVMGFGIFHIIYGILFHLKYEKQKKTTAAEAVTETVKCEGYK